MSLKIKLLFFLVASLMVVFFACQTKEVTSAKVYMQQENWEKAIEQLEVAKSNNPDDPEVQYLLGTAYAQKERWQKMDEAFENSIKSSTKFKDDIKATRDKYWVQTFNKGVKLINNNKVDEAVETFETAAVIDPKRVETFKNLAVTYIRTEELEKATDAYEKVMALAPEDVRAMVDYSRLLIQTEDFERAAEVAQKAVDADPGNADAVYNLGLAYDYMGQREKAREEYEKALANNPDNPDMLFNVARLYFMDGEMDRAIELFMQVIEKNPNDYESNLNVGNAFLQLADDLRKRIVAKEREGEEITVEERDELLGMYKNAIPYLEKALSINDADPNVWNNLGVAYVNIGESEKGKEAFEKAESLTQ